MATTIADTIELPLPAFANEMQFAFGDEWDSLGSATPEKSFGGHARHGGHSNHSGLQGKWKAERQIFNRTYSTNPDHREPYGD